jgi:hypothetical protein
VVGYPRSGNSWTSQLLADILDCPVARFGAALPLSAEGDDRPGPYVVHQVHLHVDYDDDKWSEAIPNCWTFCPSRYKGERIVYVQRDPRDVIVSVKHYWGFESIAETINAMKAGDRHFSNIGPYDTYCRRWVDWMYDFTFTGHNCMMWYEVLQKAPYSALRRILYYLQLPGKDRIEGAVQRQSFAVKRAQIEIDGETRPYGLGIQRTHLRHGKVGDWKTEFSEKDTALCDQVFGDLIKEFVYL